MREKQTGHSRRIATLGAGAALMLCLAGLPLAAQAQAQGFESLERRSLDRIVAVVNQGVIMESELEERLAQIRSQLTGQQESLPSERVLREQLLEQMILEEIQLQLARESGLAIDDTELNRQVRAIAESNGMSLEQFADALEADGLSLAVVREEIRREMLLRELHQRRVGSRVTLTEREVERVMEQEGVSREQAQQWLFQRKANEELEAWLQEVRSQAFVDMRLDRR